tara:strand:+ start:9440 stop:11011 length:1572 start_codon:yes stop_codon:yes gene_type:complete
MGSNWPIHELSEFINIKHGFAFKGENFKDEQTFDVLITPGNFSIGGGFKGDKLKYYDGPVPEDYILSEGDLVVTMTDLSKQADTLGYSARIPSLDGHRILHNQRVGLVELKSDELDPTFLYYLLQSREYRHHVVSGATGTTVKHTSPTKIVSFSFRKPPKNTQILIGKHLMAIEAKEKLNASFNQTLEQMAQALFKSWFVDFDPVFDNLLASVDFNLDNLETSLPDELKQKAQRRLAALNSLENAAECKASLIALAHELQALSQTKEATQAAVQVSGKAAETPVKANFNANPTILAQHANTHAHFPNEFEQNEQLGWIPKGWDIKAVSEAIQINPRTSLSKGSVAKFADMKSIPTSGYMVDEIIEKLFSGGVKFKRNDILLARITPCLQNGKTAWVDFLKEDEVGFGSTEFIVFRENNNISFPFIACLAKDDSFRAHCMQSMVGSSGRQRVQNACFDSYYLALPKSDVLKDMFTELTKPNFVKMTNNKLESESLSKLRDTLLPKLISGELQIPDVATDEEVVD